MFGGRDGNCSHTAKDDGLKGAPEFRKGTQAQSVSVERNRTEYYS